MTEQDKDLGQLTYEKFYEAILAEVMGSHGLRHVSNETIKNGWRAAAQVAVQAERERCVRIIENERQKWQHWTETHAFAKRVLMKIKG